MAESEQINLPGVRWKARGSVASLTLLLSVAGALVIATGCGKTNTAVAAPPPLEVQVAEVQQKDVPLYKEWIGTLDGFVNADIKAEVSGYLVKQEYTEGT